MADFAGAGTRRARGSRRADGQVIAAECEDADERLVAADVAFGRDDAGKRGVADDGDAGKLFGDGAEKLFRIVLAGAKSPCELGVGDALRGLGGGFRASLRCLIL